MSEKLSKEEWKAQVLKLLENTPIARPKTTEKVEELRSEIFNKFAKLASEELKLLKNKESVNDTQKSNKR